MLLSFAFDLLLAVFLIVFGLIGCFGVYHYYVFIIWPRYSVVKGLLVIVDGILVVYTVWHSAKVVIFLIHSLNLVIYVIVARQAVMTQTVKTLVGASIKNKVAQVQLAAYLPAYIRWQLRVIAILLTTNRKVVSPLLLLTIVSMFGANVYATAMLVLKRLLFEQKMLLLVVCALQTFFTFLGLLPMIKATGALYRSCRYLHLAQPALDKSNLSLKIKLFTLNEVLTSGSKFAFTVGSVGKVTSHALFEVIF